MTPLEQEWEQILVQFEDLVTDMKKFREKCLNAVPENRCLIVEDLDKWLDKLKDVYGHTCDCCFYFDEWEDYWKDYYEGEVR